MRFGRKSRAGARDGRPRTAVAPRKAQTTYDLGTNDGTDGLPGRAGYPNGPRTELPTFFHMRRPDGRPDPVYKKKFFFG